MELIKIKPGGNRNRFRLLVLLMVLYADFTFCLANFGFSPLMALIKEDLQLYQQQIAAVACITGIKAVVILIPASILTEQFDNWLNC